MDKLIKSDDLIAIFTEKAKEWRGNGPLPSMESLMWDAAVSLTENAPIIDAIPVEWLKNRQSKIDRGSTMWWVIEVLVKEWQKE